MKKLISVVTPTFNEVENLKELSDRITAVMALHPQYEYEHIIIDNASTDGTVELIRDLSAKNPRIKAILNTRNFGHIRSPFHGLLQAGGDAAILIASDLQDPPEMISELLEKWEHGFKNVMAVKKTSSESKLMFAIRRRYYKWLDAISDVKQIRDATGSGLYDHVVIEQLRMLRDPYPYHRGLIAELGFPVATVLFDQPRRIRGVTKNNFLTLYDMAMLGITKHSKMPLRIMTLLGFITATASLIAALVLLVLKLAFWDSFDAGVAPILISVFFFGAIQMLFAGILGEYIGNIFTQVRNLPLVVESERINF
jgi:glycosyltransferase involved in cell wall biosynthesis